MRLSSKSLLLCECVETLLCVCKIFAYYQPFERHLCSTMTQTFCWLYHLSHIVFPFCSNSFFVFLFSLSVLFLGFVISQTLFNGSISIVFRFQLSLSLSSTTAFPFPFQCSNSTKLLELKLFVCLNAQSLLNVVASTYKTFKHIIRQCGCTAAAIKTCKRDLH